MRRFVPLVLLLASSAAAQEPAELRAARSLAAAGRTDSARTLLRRLAIEQSNSPWADDALLELATMALSGGNPVAAYDLAGRVRSDYPGSELRPRAALLAGRAAIEASDARTGCALLDSAVAEAADDIELANAIGFHRSRCPALLAAPVVPRPRPDAGLARADSAAFGVQVAAARSDAEAQRLAQRLRAAGHAPQVQRGDDGLTRVRVGPYRSRAEADSVARVLRDFADGAPFVVRMP